MDNDLDKLERPPPETPQQRRARFSQIRWEAGSLLIAVICIALVLGYW